MVNTVSPFIVRVSASRLRVFRIKLNSPSNGHASSPARSRFAEDTCNARTQTQFLLKTTRLDDKTCVRGRSVKTWWRKNPIKSKRARRVRLRIASECCSRTNPLIDKFFGTRLRAFRVRKDGKDPRNQLHSCKSFHILHGTRRCKYGLEKDCRILWVVVKSVQGKIFGSTAVERARFQFPQASQDDKIFFIFFPYTESISLTNKTGS